MSEELRPCPFCGKKPNPNWTDESYIECTNRKCSVYGYGMSTGDWNTRPIEDDLRKRIAELEALVERLIEAGNKLGTYFIGYTPRKKELLQREFWEAWRSAVSDWQSMTSHVTNPSDSQGIVTRNGGEG